MNIGDSPIVKMITGLFGQVIKFFDNAYNEGWLLYLIFGMIVLVIIVIIFN